MRNNFKNIILHLKPVFGKGLDPSKVVKTELQKDTTFSTFSTMCAGAGHGLVYVNI